MLPDIKHLVFTDDAKRIRTTDLSLYLAYFTVAYTCAMEEEIDDRYTYARLLDYYDENQPNNDSFDIELIRNSLANEIGSLPIEVRNGMKSRDLEIERMSKNSPLEIWFYGVSSALSLAVILSGGEIDLKNMKFKLPPIGDGIKSLRESLKIEDKSQDVNIIEEKPNK